MKLLERDRDRFLFQVGKREKRLLIEVLKLYPLIPTARQPAGRTADATPLAANQRLLDAALQERRQENRRQLLAMLKDERRFQETEDGYHLTLRAAQMEWLLQVVNDIRVGSWLILGEPDEKKGKPIELNNENARYYAAMEFCGYIQMNLLDAFAGEES